MSSKAETAVQIEFQYSPSCMTIDGVMRKPGSEGCIGSPRKRRDFQHRQDMSWEIFLNSVTVTISESTIPHEEFHPLCQEHESFKLDFSANTNYRAIICQNTAELGIIDMLVGDGN
jgi:hypothetical protein